MTVPALAPRRRSEKGEATQARVLDAALECLQSDGYAGTSVVQVQQRAGISRGAVQHYWPSKAALVVAAVDRLLGEVINGLIQQVRERSRVGDRIDVGVEEFWSVFQHPMLTVLADLVAASRTDPELRAVMLPRELPLREQVAHLAAEVFGPELASHPRFPMLSAVFIHSLQGAALSKVLDPVDTPRPELVAEWKAVLRDCLGPRPQA